MEWLERQICIIIEIQLPRRYLLLDSHDLEKLQDNRSMSRSPCRTPIQVTIPASSHQKDENSSQRSSETSIHAIDLLSNNRTSSTIVTRWSRSLGMNTTGLSGMQFWNLYCRLHLIDLQSRIENPVNRPASTAFGAIELCCRKKRGYCVRSSRIVSCWPSV